MWGKALTTGRQLQRPDLYGYDLAGRSTRRRTTADREKADALDTHNGSNRDIIVIGASLGGVAALSSLVAQLPPDLPAAVLVVQHISENSRGLLGDILHVKGALRAHQARDGMPVERGVIYVAPPNRHLLLTENGLRVVFGPRENRARPAIDPLFRTAAVSHRSRVIGVILTGLLGDGAAGLLAVTRCSGAAVVQAPEDAAHPEMPQRALALVKDAIECPLADMGTLLTELTNEPAPEPTAVPEALRIEARLTERAMQNEDWLAVPGHASGISCPDCGGSLRQLDVDGSNRYRCRVGHAFSAEALAAAQSLVIEEALWAALRALDERADMLVSLARDEAARGSGHSATSYETRANEMRLQADRLRELLVVLAR